MNDVPSSGVRDRILRTASDLFCADGLRGVGVNRIIEDRLAAMFDALLWDGHPEDYRGTAFLKASAEARAGSAEHLRVAEHRAGVLGWIRRLTRQAGAAGPNGLASQLVLLLEGALALGMGALDPSRHARRRLPPATSSTRPFCRLPRTLRRPRDSDHIRRAGQDVIGRGRTGHGQAVTRGTDVMHVL